MRAAAVAGDVVREDDVIAQIETDKVTFDIKYPSKTPGVVKEVGGWGRSQAHSKGVLGQADLHEEC